MTEPNLTQLILDRLDRIDATVDKLADRVGTQNGRVGKQELLTAGLEATVNRLAERDVHQTGRIGRLELWRAGLDAHAKDTEKQEQRKDEAMARWKVAGLYLLGGLFLTSASAFIGLVLHSAIR